MSQIQLLKNDVTMADKKLSDLLRKVKMIATELKSKDFLEWVEKELGGYGKNDKVPIYRVIKGEPKGWNPYNGWIPLIIGNPDVQENISKRAVSQSIGELEQLFGDKSDNKFLQIPYPETIQKEISDSVECVTKFTLMIPENSIFGILEVVRNKLVDYLIEIDKKYDKTMPNIQKKGIIFPDEIIKKLPKDLKILADDFNFNFNNSRPVTSMLILRRMLPLAIVKKFQKLNRETEIQDSSGDYFDTKALLGKVESLLSNKRIYNELMNYKILIDSSQHSYSLNIQMSDAEGAAIKLRVFLDDIF